MSSKGMVRTVLGRIWRALDGVRKFIHMIILFSMVLVLLGVLAPKETPLPDSGALVLAPSGALVEQLSGDPVDRAIAKAQGAEIQETLIKDVIDAVQAAKDDERITALVLQLDNMTAAGLSKLQRVSAAIEQFKTSGKKVIAVGDGYTRNQYFLAAQADELLMHPMGFVFIDGYSRYIPYFKEALDKLSVDFNTWRVGEYKSFVEPFIRNDMSEEDRESSQVWLNALWRSYQEQVVAARGLEEDALDRYANNAVALMGDAGGDTGKLALDFGLVDELLNRDEMRKRLIEVAGQDEDDENTYSAIRLGRYVASLRADQEAPKGNKVAVVVAVGNILDGTQPPGTIGGDSTAKLIRKAIEDEDVKALVLRVDSGGGSVFASDVISRAVQVFKESGRPYVASMGSVAASGGYYISMAADEIWANQSTITGSIGIGAQFPTVNRSLARLGINVDGLGTTELAGQARPDRALGEDINLLIRQSIDQGYRNFIGQVAAHRDKTVEEIDAVARGRVWIGADAHELGLVDQIGNLDQAIAAAARRAGLEEGDYEVEYLKKELEFAEQLALRLAVVVAPLARALGIDQPFPDSVRRIVTAIEARADALLRLNDPKGLYALCLCDVR